MLEILTLTDETFDETVGRSNKPILVDFWAEWCAPCLALEPILAEVAAEETESLRVGRLNILEHPLSAERLEVQTIPTLILFRDGEPVKRMFGACNKRQIMEGIRDYIDLD